MRCLRSWRAGCSLWYFICCVMPRYRCKSTTLVGVAGSARFVQMPVDARHFRGLAAVLVLVIRSTATAPQSARAAGQDSYGCRETVAARHT